MNVFVKFITIQSRLEKKPSDRLGCNYTHKGICHFQHNMRILIYGITAGELPASIKIAGETILYLMTRIHPYRCAIFLTCVIRKVKIAR